MEQHLQNQDSFDQHIFSKLAALESPMPDGSWDAFSQILDAELPASPEAAFDAILKKSVGTIGASASTNNWDSLSRLMDKDPILGNTPENVADYAVRSKLNYSEPSYNPQHWQQLSDKLDLQDDRTVKVVLFKSIELALIFALLLTTFNYYVPTNLFEQKRKNVEDSPKQQLPGKKRAATKDVPMAANTPQYLEPSDYLAENGGAIFASEFGNGVGGAMSVAALTTNSNGTTRSNDGAADQLPLLLPSLLPLGEKALQFGFSPKSNLVASSSTKGAIRLGVSSTLDRNYVLTPYEASSNEAAYTSQVWGYGAGVSIAYQKGKWELESGVNYSNKKYQPKATIIQNTSPRAIYESYSVKSVNMDIVEVPLNVRYHFAKKQKVKVYASAGVSMNLAMNANYDRVEYYPILSPQQPRIAATNPVKDGLLHGGTFNNNSYLTANIGAGLEYALTEKRSVFLQTAYHHSLNEGGVGPKNDRLNNFSIQAGARITL